MNGSNPCMVYTVAMEEEAGGRRCTGRRSRRGEENLPHFPVPYPPPKPQGTITVPEPLLVTTPTIWVHPGTGRTSNSESNLTRKRKGLCSNIESMGLINESVIGCNVHRKRTRNDKVLGINCERQAMKELCSENLSHRTRTKCSRSWKRKVERFLYDKSMWSMWIVLFMVFVHFDFCRGAPVTVSWTTDDSTTDPGGGGVGGPSVTTGVIVRDVTAGQTSWTQEEEKSPPSDKRSNSSIIRTDPGGVDTFPGPSPGQKSSQSAESAKQVSRPLDDNGKSQTRNTHLISENIPTYAVKSGGLIDEVGGVEGDSNEYHHLPFVQSRPPGVSADLQVLPEVTNTTTHGPRHTDDQESLTTQAPPLSHSDIQNLDINNDNNLGDHTVSVHPDLSTQDITSLPFRGSHGGLLLPEDVGVTHGGVSVENSDYHRNLSVDPSHLGSTVIIPVPQRDSTVLANLDEITTSGNVGEAEDPGVFIPILNPSVTASSDKEKPIHNRDEISIPPTYDRDPKLESLPGGGDNRQAGGILLTTMINVVDRSEGSTPKTVVNQLDGFDVGSLQFDLKDIILAVCGTVACMFTLCMLVTFTRCCCKKPKEDSDEEQQPQSVSQPSKSLWKRSWKRPLDSTATTHTQESSTSENITQVTIERRESYRDDRDSGESSDDEEGGFTCGRASRNTDTSKSRKSNFPESDDNKNALSVKDRIRAFESPVVPDPGEVKVREGIKPRKNKPTSKAFEEFESKGILIGFGGGPRRRHGDEDDEHEDGEGICDSPIGILLPSPTSGLSQEDTPTSSRGLEDDEGVHTMESEEDEFAAIQRNTEILKSFRRAPPPKNRSKSRRSGRGRRPMRGQDVSSSEQIAEEPSSGSFGSRPTSGINSPATSATPEEEHDSFEASLHMTTTESLSAARSSSISQTPQSSMDSMDSPKRQPSLSSRDSPLRGSLTDSPKRLLDSPKRQVRDSPKRTPPVQRASDMDRSPGAYQHPGERILHEKNGPSDFSLSIPMDFQQQRLGVHHISPDSGKPFGKPHRPKSYHVDLAGSHSNEGSHRPSDRVRPLRPMSQVQQTEMDLFSRDPTAGSHDLVDGSHDQNHLHEPQQQRDTISLSHGHLARNISSPVGRVVPQIRQPSSPELRRWESEHSYLEEGWKPSRLRDGKNRPRMASPDQSSTSQAREMQTLRPTPEESQVREHPQSEKLERKVLLSETPESAPQAPDRLTDQGVTGVPTSEKTFLPNHDLSIPPPRPPLPSWRQINPPWKPETSDSKELPPRSPVKLSYVTHTDTYHSSLTRERSLIRDKSFERAPLMKNSTQPTPNKHFSSDPDIKSDLSKKLEPLPRRDFSRDADKTIEFTQSMDFERNWRDSTRRGRSLDRAQYTAPLDTRFVQSNPDVFNSHALSTREIPFRDISPDQAMRQSGRQRNRFRSEGHNQGNLPSPESAPNYKPPALTTSISWHGNSLTPKANVGMVNGEQEIPWLRPLEGGEATDNVKPSDVRKSIRRSRAKSAEDTARNTIEQHDKGGFTPVQRDYPREGEHAVSPPDQIQRQLSMPQYTSPPGNRRSRRDMYEVQPMPLDFKRNNRRSQSLRTPKSPETQRRPEPRRSMRDNRARYTDPEINRRLHDPEFMRPAFMTSKSWEERSATFPRHQVHPTRTFETGTYRPPQGLKILSSDPYLMGQPFNRVGNTDKHAYKSNHQAMPVAQMNSSKERITYPVQNITEPVMRREIRPDNTWEKPALTAPYKKSPEPKQWRNAINMNHLTTHVSSAPQLGKTIKEYTQPYKTNYEDHYPLQLKRSPHQLIKNEGQNITVNSAFEQTRNNIKPSHWERPKNIYGGNKTKPAMVNDDIRNSLQDREVQYLDKQLSPMNQKDFLPEISPNVPEKIPERILTPKTMSRGTDTLGFLDQNSNPPEKLDELWQDEFGCIKRNVTVQTDDLDQAEWKEDEGTGTFYPKSLPLNGNMPPDISSSIDTNLNTWEAIDGPASNLEPNGHKVLRFTQDPRWKDSLVKPEVTNMYDRNILLERHQNQVGGGEIERPGSQQSVDISPKMRNTPDVVPRTERTSQRDPLLDTDYHFSFNFEVEATEI